MSEDLKKVGDIDCSDILGTRILGNGNRKYKGTCSKSVTELIHSGNNEEVSVVLEEQGRQTIAGKKDHRLD